MTAYPNSVAIRFSLVLAYFSLNPFGEQSGILAQCNQLITNHTVTANQFGVSMNAGNVSGWQIVHRTPVPPHIPDSSYCAYWRTPPNGILLISRSYKQQSSSSWYVEGNAFGQQLKGLTQGENYVLSIRIGKGHAGTGALQNGRLKVMLRHRSNSANTIPAQGWTQRSEFYNIMAGPNQEILSEVPPHGNDSCGTFVQHQVCFTATSDWDFIVIYAEANQVPYTSQMPVTVDDVELYEVSPDAGPDTVICKGNCVTLGKACNGDVIALSQSFKWYELGSSTVLGNGPTLQVCPGSSKDYVLKRTLDSLCIGYDTVSVTVTDSVWFSLGPDTSLCGGCDTIYGPSPPGGATYTYLWNTGATTQNIVVCHSGQYILEVSTPGGCKHRDTINFTIRPEIRISPPDTIVCANAFAFYLSVEAGFSSYLWNDNSTSNELKIFGPGKYWVTVTDSSGCQATDTARVDTIPSDFADLGADDTLCTGSTRQLCGPAGPYGYLWSTGDTVRCIEVGAGTYILKVYTSDSCIDYDTITLYEWSSPVVSLDSIGPFCYNDNPVSLKGFPGGGTYEGTGVSNDKFYPDLAGEGLHTVIYTYTDNNGCTGTDSILVRVFPPVDAYIDPFGPFCENSEAVTITTSKTGGVFTGLDAGNVFDPALKGPGNHLVTYTYTDSNGCSFTDSAYLIVFAKPSVTIISDTSGQPCAQEPVLLEAITEEGEMHSYSYYWTPGGNTTDQLWVQGNGTWQVVVSDDSTGCTDTATFTSNLPDCCEGEADIASLLEITGAVSWQNMILHVDADIHVKSGGVLTIRNSKIYMRGCSRIRVEPQGRLIIDSSSIGMCNWFGIEVWGNYDVCQTSDLSDPYNNITGQGFAWITNSIISDAEVGVLAGRAEDQVSPPVDRRYWGGGVIYLRNDTFVGNYVDIIFSEYSAHTLLAWYNPPPPHSGGTCIHYYNISSVEQNVFLNMKDSSCGRFAESYLAEYGFSRCHILISSDNLYIWSINANQPVPPNWPPPDYLKGEPLYLPYGPPPNSNAYSCPCGINYNNYINNCYTNHHLK